ncbi:MAG TPA: prepilin-type N-terminal cleavage/methylation domain-containing protein [Phycisphaerae bacterium]|nr:prepilin-type N-terminal cleavage/methylation domain-containing protein [Phycisphaerae bacterium]
MPTRRRKLAFTVIELLVVIAIISVLLAVLLPACSSARDRARRIVCANNIRSIWTGVFSYSLTWDDRVPFMEDVNLTLPDADPFDPQYPTTAGVVLEPFVQPGSWRCPSAVAGFPASAGQGQWKLTYTFSAAGPIGQGIPYDDHPDAGTGGILDPAVSNYVHFDGRFIKLLDGRRYVQSGGLNTGPRGNWNVRRPVIAEALGGDTHAGKFIYPHRGALDPRNDLGAARATFFQNSNHKSVKTGYYELHADGESPTVVFTRHWEPHWPGF